MKNSKTKKRDAKRLPLYILVRVAKFTLLEKFVLKAIERELRTDKDIADALCLEKDDVSFVIEDDGLKDIIEGDYTRRSIKSDFKEARKEWLIVDSKGKDFTQPALCTKECLKYFSSLPDIKFPKKKKIMLQWRAEKSHALPTDLDNAPAKIANAIKESSCNLNAGVKK